jgi:hypothetical protein
MSSKGWFNLEAVGGTIPETQFFESDSAFSSHGLTCTQRVYGFATWYVVVVPSLPSTSTLVSPPLPQLSNDSTFTLWNLRDQAFCSVMICGDDPVLLM